jgi:hypothetical protein
MDGGTVHPAIIPPPGYKGISCNVFGFARHFSEMGMLRANIH